ncbi:hypothetical protein HDV00_003580 [Rhizophlyctis rosea]|nr:hypothetical protein HDV00_003580 [Rhizophlyctis rosea]
MNYVGTLPEKILGTVPTATPTEANTHPTAEHKALEFHGAKDVRVLYHPKPLISHEKDCVVRITTTTVCGSDLHLYHRLIPELKTGYVLGHEGVGIVESVGSGVKDIKVGQRVAVSAIQICGECWYCQQELFSCCDRTNNSGTMNTLYGHRSAGILGYSHLLGGYEGTQAEYVRVPFADLNVLPLPENISDDKALSLSDIACTSYHGTDLGEVSDKEGRNNVAIWGLGPVGLLAVQWAFVRGAKKVVAIDNVPERLAIAEKMGAVPLDFSKKDVYETLMKEFPGKGPDVAIDCVGFRYNKSWLTTIQKKLSLETDSLDVIAECIKCVRKGGVMVLIGDYIAYANGFPIGAMMEKGLTTKGGQVHVQKYWKHILQLMIENKFDPSVVYTGTYPFEKIADIYKQFDEKADGMVKPIIKTEYAGKIPTVA